VKVRIRPVVAVVAVAGALAGAATCKRSSTSPPAAREDRVLVFAAEPLRDAFSTMLPDFQWAKPGVDVQFTFGDAHEVGTKIERGAAFDVVAACDEASWARWSGPAAWARPWPSRATRRSSWSPARAPRR
jgi:ABC-type molybdate transport system substrate-binding protein